MLTFPANLLRLLFLVLVALCIVASPLAAQPNVPQAPLELTATNLASVVDPLMDKWITKYNGPGAVVVVVKHDGQVFAKGYGFADIEAKKPFTADATLVRPGSISKLFTGISVMQLVDAGRLDLDRDVNDYIDFTIPMPEGGVPVTLRRLLTHRAGFEEHVKGLFSSDPEPQPLGRWLKENLPRRLFPKGDIEAYSNYGFALAGYIVERASGEFFASYVQQHILDPLGMSRSTFQQPLPPDLAPLVAKSYLTSDQPPLPFFETIPAVPAGALTASGADMGRFARMLLNGGELDGARILSRMRLDEMMAPSSSTPAGYLGLAFIATKIAGHDAIWHNGGTMRFLSDLKIFPAHDLGIFVSRDGFGEIKTAEEIPDIVTAIATRFLPEAPDAADPGTFSSPSETEIAGVYHTSRRAESSFLRLSDLIGQIVVAIDSTGNAVLHSASWPFGDGVILKHVGRNLYEGPVVGRVAFVGGDSEPYLATPTIRLQRVPWYLDARWVTPAFIVSVVLVILTLLAWPISALWRRWRKKPWSQDRGDRRHHLAVKLILLIDAAAIVIATVLFAPATANPTVLNDALDPAILTVYGLAWLGVFGTIPILWATIRFWRKSSGSRWLRIHHSLIAASSIMIAWFFLTFRIAGTTLIY